MKFSVTNRICGAWSSAGKFEQKQKQPRDMHNKGSEVKMVNVVRSAGSDVGGLFIAAVDRVCVSDGVGAPERVAFDCEGVNLSRLGTVELISICFSSSSTSGDSSTSEVFLIDVGGDPDPEILRSIKQLFEDSKVTKIIHDCCMDSDALFHTHHIELKNVHDTSCFHAEITGRENENLNEVLRYNGIHGNDSRDKNAYKHNPAFWATRPLTQTMIDWASSDVNRLLDVAERQLDVISEGGRERAIQKSDNNMKIARDMEVKSGLRVPSSNVGRFIGTRGANIRSLQRRTGTVIYQIREERTWFVYYPSTAALESVKRAMSGRN